MTIKMGKKIITLDEAGMAKLLKKILNEASKPKTFDATTAKVLKDSGDQNNDALKRLKRK